MSEFKSVYSKYETEKIAKEFTKLKDQYYLEHVGATLYSDEQIKNVYEDLKNNLFGNPHAFNTSSKFTEDVIDQVRSQILDHFNTTLDEYSVIFTSGATNALKIIAESFDYSEIHENKNGSFVYLEDNHTSVLGMRQHAKNFKVLKNDDAFNIFNNYKKQIKNDYLNTNSLFVFPAQSNFSGTKYPLNWIEKVQNGALNQIFDKNFNSKWFCVLDAASFVSCNFLDLNKFKPDFVCISFYKIFGYPTGLGALLVKNESDYVLRKKYFGGGTVQIALDKEFTFRPVLHERFEDGTLPFLSIISLTHGFATLKRLTLTMNLISAHTFSLAKYIHDNLLVLHHFNGNPVAILYQDTNFDDIETQGGVVNFNLLRDNKKFIGYAEVLEMANLYKIHLRTGCFCNPGACRKHLKLTENDAKKQFNAGHVCGDQNDLIDGQPTGSVRVSFGYMSRKEDADQLLKMIEDCFITQPVIKKLPKYWNEFQEVYKNKFYSKQIENNYKSNNNEISKELTLKTDVNNKEKNVLNEKIVALLKYIFVYPIKSCGAYTVENKWNIESTGLNYDREWMIVTLSGVCLTQKREPKLCLLKPNINLEQNILELKFPGMPSTSVPLKLKENNLKITEASLCKSKVCGDRVKCVDCGDEIAFWLCEAFQRSDLRLLRQNSDHSRTNRKGEQAQLSLANQANYLLINTASIKYLANSIPNFVITEESLFNLIARFRANLVVDCKTPFVENSCNEIKINDHIFKCTGPCTRCQMICIDQLTAEKSVEPLKTLSVLTESKIRFGVYLSHELLSNKQITKGENVIFQ